MAAGVQTDNQTTRLGALFSALLHLLVLAFCVWYFRHPLTTQIVAAGEGEGGDGKAIEVGVVAASQLGFIKPKPVSFVGEESTAANNVVVETKKPEPAPNAEVLPSNSKSPKPKEKVAQIERPTGNQTEQSVSKQPLRGGSANTNVEVGRSFGSPAPALTIGVGGGNARVGDSGAPGGSEYGRRIQMILSRNYNPPGGYDNVEPHYVIIRLRIARDGHILSLVNGRVAPNYITRRSPIYLVTNAAEGAIIDTKQLPPFPDGFLMSAEEAVAEIWFRYPK